MAWWKGTVALASHVLDRLRIVDLAEPEQTMEGLSETQSFGFSVGFWFLASSSRRLG